MKCKTITEKMTKIFTGDTFLPHPLGYKWNKEIQSKSINIRQDR